jgi:predicted RNA methylase
MLASLSTAPPLPTPHEACEKMLELANVKKGDMMYDLGCGDGRIIICAAKKFGARSIGFELSIPHYFITKYMIWKNRIGDRVKVFYKSFYAADLSKADVVTLFGFPATMPRIKKKVIERLKSGTRVVSYAFPISDLKPQKVLRFKKYAPIYLYIIINVMK